MARVHSRVRPRLISIAKVEPWLVVPSALLLLLYPNPLVGPAMVAGSLPTALRLFMTGRPWRGSTLDVPLALLVVGSLLGAWSGVSSYGVATRLTGLLAALMLYGAIVEHATTPRRLHALALALLLTVTAATLTLLGLVAPFLRLDRVPPLEAAIHTLDGAGFARWLADQESVQDDLLQRYRLRTSGVGGLADVGLALVFALQAGIRAWRWRLALVPPILVYGVALLVADNRGSILAAALTLGMMAAIRRPRLLVMMPVALLAAFGLFGAGLVERGVDPRTVYQRVAFWDNGLYLAREHLLTGVGLGTASVQSVYRSYFGEGLESIQPGYRLYFRAIDPSFRHAHSIYVQALLEQGLVGQLGLVGLVLGTLRLGWRLRWVDDHHARAAGTAGFGMALAWFTTGLSEIGALTTIGGALLLGALGLLAAATATAERRPSGTEHAEPPGRRPGPLWAWRTRVAASHPRFAYSTSVPLRLVGGLALAAALVLVQISGAGSRGAGLVLLNLGAAELNRATWPEDVTGDVRDRAASDAVRHLRAAAAIMPNDPAVQRNLALGLAAAEEYRDARSAAFRARALTPPTDARGQLQLARALLAAGLWDEASRAFAAGASRTSGTPFVAAASSQIIRSSTTPASAPRLLGLGNYLLRVRNWDRAIAAYTAAATVEPTSREAYAGIIRAADARGDSVERQAALLELLIARGGAHEHHARLELHHLYRQGAVELGPAAP